MTSFARRSERLGDGLLAASLFFVLVWWRVSVYFFVAGALLALCSRLLDREQGLPLAAVPDGGAV